MTKTLSESLRHFMQPSTTDYCIFFFGTTAHLDM